MLRVVYYTLPWYLDVALPFVRELSRRCELHLFLQLAPEAWCAGLFDVRPMGLPSGVLEADPILRHCFPPGVRAYWQDAASFHLVVHNAPTLRPATWRVGRQAIQRMQQLHPHVLHLEDAQLRLPVRALKRVPLVLSVHDPKPHSGEGSWRDTWARRLTFARAQRFILHNQSDLGPFCAAYGLPSTRVDALPLGVYDIWREWITGPAAGDDLTLLFFGRLSPYKGLEVLFMAAPLVCARVPGVKFVVAGRPAPGFHMPALPSLPNGGRLEIMTEYIPNARLAELFQSAALVVCPYVDATQSGVVLTAYAFDKPVVATMVGGLPEYVWQGDTGLLVPPRDPVALAEALILVLTDNRVRQRLQAGAAQARVGKLSWSGIAEATMRAYSACVE